MTEFVRFVALRYLASSRRRSTVALISLISIIGLALGVATLITVLSVMDGLIAKTEETVLRSSTHANVYKLVGNFDNYRDVEQQLRSIPGIIGASPVVFSEVLLMSERSLAGAALNGIDEEAYKEIADLENMMVKGSYGCMVKPDECEYVRAAEAQNSELDDFLDEKASVFPVIIGVDLAEKLQVSPGSVISLVTSGGTKVIGEESLPVSGNFVVVGVFESGMYDFDVRSIYSRLEDAQTLLDIGQHVSFVSLKVDKPGQMELFEQMIKERTGGFPFAVQDWRDLHKTTFKFFRLQKVIMFIILAFITLVASFGIITTLIMLVISKTREISILRSVGAKRRVITGIFMFDGFMIGLFGTILGALIAVVACVVLKHVEFSISKEVYFFSYMPVEMSAGTFAVVIASTLLISVAATLYPSIKASGITPVEGLRHE